METGNIANATGLVMNWVDELNASSQKYGLDPGKWIASQMTGTPYDLSPQARSLSRREPLYALESSKAFAQNEGGREQIQAFIDRLKAFWATQSPSPQTQSGGPPVLPQVQPPPFPPPPIPPPLGWTI